MLPFSSPSHHRSAGVFLSDGGTLGRDPTPSPAPSSSSHHAHSASSPMQMQQRPPTAGVGNAHDQARPAGLASTEFQTPLGIGPSIGKLQYEGKNVHRVLSQRSKGGSLLPSPGSSPGKRRHPRSARVSNVETGHGGGWGVLRPISSARKQLNLTFDPHASPNNMLTTPLSRKHGASRGGFASPTHQTLPERGLVLVTSPNAKRNAATMPDRTGGHVGMPNFVMIHGQVQELLSTAADAGVLSKEHWTELENQASKMFQLYDHLVMELQRPAHAQRKIDLNDAVRQKDENEPAPTTQSTAAELEAASPTAADGEALPSPISTGSLDLNMHQPLPDNLFYSSHVASTMPTPGLHMLPGGIPNRQATLRKSFKLASALQDLRHEDDMIHLPAHSPASSRNRTEPRQARVEEIVMGEEGEQHVAHVVTSMALQSSSGDADSPLRIGSQHDDSTSKPPVRREASYIVQSRIHPHDAPSVGSARLSTTYNWDTRSFEFAPSEIVSAGFEGGEQPMRKSFRVEDVQAERDSVQIEYQGEGGQENQPIALQEKSGSYHGKKVHHAKPLDLTYLQHSSRPSFSRQSMSFSEHSIQAATVEVWPSVLMQEDYSKIEIPLSAKKMPLTPRDLNSPDAATMGGGKTPRASLKSPSHIRSPLTPNLRSPLTPRTDVMNSPSLRPSANQSASKQLSSSPSLRPSPSPSNGNMRAKGKHHHRSATFSTFSQLSTLPEVVVVERNGFAAAGENHENAKLAKLPSFELMSEENDVSPLPPPMLELMQEQPAREAELTKEAPISTEVSAPAASEELKPVDPHVAALLRARQRENSMSISRKSNSVSSRKSMSRKSASRRSNRNEDEVDQLLTSSPPRPQADSAMPTLAAVPIQPVASESTEVGSSADVPAQSCSPRTLASLRAEILSLQSSQASLESNLAAAHYAHSDLANYVSHMRARFMQRAFLVVKFHSASLSSSSSSSSSRGFLSSITPSSARRFFALSLDGTKLWWSHHASMEGSKSLAILEIMDVRVALVGMRSSLPGDEFRSSNGGPEEMYVDSTPMFGLAEMMAGICDYRVEFDPTTDTFIYPPSPDTSTLFQLRRSLYRRVLNALKVVGDTKARKEGELLAPAAPTSDEYEESAEEAEERKRIRAEANCIASASSAARDTFMTPTRSSQPSSTSLTSPTPSFFPSPLKRFHAAHWRVSFHSPSRTLDLLFQTKSDLDVWIEFMQRVWMMKMRKRMEEQAELWRRQRHQKPATATAAAAK